MIANRLAASDKKLVLTAIRIVLMAVTALLLQGLLMAQTSGTILGSVKDQSGAVLPGATISVTNTDTGITRSSVSGAKG